MELTRVKEMMKIPDPAKHLKISLIKSTLRIIAGTFLIYNYVLYAGLILIIAELLGIAEELV